MKCSAALAAALPLTTVLGSSPASSRHNEIRRAVDKVYCKINNEKLTNKKRVIYNVINFQLFLLISSLLSVISSFLSCLQFPIDVKDRITRICIEEPCGGVQFEHELGPLSEEETKVSRKFIKFIMEFAIKECLDNTPTTFCLKRTVARDGFLPHCILSRI
jgi:hypothetical protein